MVDLTEGVVIGGRKFRQATDMTFEQELYVMSVVTEAGLIDLKTDGTASEAGLTETVMSVIVKAYSSGKLMILLASLLQEEGTDWSIPMVEANAVWFSSLKDRESKDALLQVMTMALLAFFESGDVARLISQKSSVSLHPKEDSNSAVPESPKSEEALTSESGTL